MRITWLVVVLGAMLFGMGATACERRPEPEPLTVTSEPPEVVKSKEQTAAAKRLGEEWQSNATLQRVYRTFEGSMTPNPPREPIYVFGSLAEPDQMLHVSFINNEPKPEHKPAQPYELSMIPINIDDWHVDPQTALEKAENEGGGKAFREAHLAGYRVLQQLARYEGAPLTWYFRYDTGDGSRLRREIWIDAKSGQLERQGEKTV